MRHSKSIFTDDRIIVPYIAIMVTFLSYLGVLISSS